MMKMPKIIALHDADGWKHPNLALMKLSAWHKAWGITVERYVALRHMAYDRIYAAKVFSWSKDNLPEEGVIRGGTGYENNQLWLSDGVEHICPDYDLYPGVDYSMGFLTRGCIRSCPWCVVPEKEGEIRAHADIEEFARHRNVMLLDNNVLAHIHGITQIEKMARLDLKVDFNQGLDARLIDKPIAERLARLRWFKALRLACDHKGQMPEVERAVKLLRAAGVKPQRYSCYVLVKDIDDALERVEFLRGLNVTPFAQPYRDTQGTPITEEQRRFARWVNLPMLFKSVAWENEARNTGIKGKRPPLLPSVVKRKGDMQQHLFFEGIPMAVSNASSGSPRP